MKRSETTLYTVVGLTTVISGGVFGLLDIFGFVDGRHALSIKLLLTAALLVYIQVIATFLLNFIQMSVKPIVFGLCGVLFTITFMILNTDLLLALLSGGVYGLFVYYIHVQSHTRSQLYVRFLPSEIFFPVLKSSLTFFLIFLSLIAYSQSRTKVLNNTLVSPEVVRIISKPTVFMLNRQINGQLHSGTSALVLESLPPDQREKAVRASLRKTVDTIADSKTGLVYGIPADQIQTQYAHVSPQGILDIEPVAERLYPVISQTINDRIQQYPIVAPLIVASVVFVLMQTLLLPLRGIEGLLTLIVFKILLATSVLTITRVQKEVEIPRI